MGLIDRVCRTVIGIALISTISACTAFDPLNSTGEAFNRNTTEYSNDAILMNLIRSKLYEPLSFITITSVSGTSSATGSLAFGPFVLGPAKPPVTYILGPFSATRANTNTFNVNVIDDPASFAALLAPVNPAMIGFFINQGYPRELLFFLLVDRLRQVDKDKSGNIVKVAQYFNDPDDPSNFRQFANKMTTLLRWGLTAEIDITASPAGRALPLSKFCMDPSLPPPPFVTSPTPSPQVPANSTALCENAPWIATQNTAPSGPSTGGKSAGETSGTAGGTTSMTVSPNGVLWTTVGNQILRISADGSNIKAIDLPKPIKPPSAGLVAFEFDDGNGSHYQLFTRSTYGAYNYIGSILRNGDIDNLLKPDSAGYGGMVRVETSGFSYGENCFAVVVYRNIQYCVPVSASRTKSLFALLHQLQQLNTAPSNTPATLTVVPG